MLCVLIAAGVSLSLGLVSERNVSVCVCAQTHTSLSISMYIQNHELLPITPFLTHHHSVPSVPFFCIFSVYFFVSSPAMRNLAPVIHRIYT